MLILTIGSPLQRDNEGTMQDGEVVAIHGKRNSIGDVIGIAVIIRWFGLSEYGSSLQQVSGKELEEQLCSA